MAPIGVSVKNIVSQGAATAAPLHTNAVTRRTSLLLREGLTIEEWTRIGVQLDRTMDSSTWWLGDWLVYGRSRFPERYRRVIEVTAFDYQTLRNYAWVANRVPPPRRRPALSFQHHAEVAALDAALQSEWLALAEQNRWSRNRLRTEVRAALRAVDAPPTEDDVLRLRVGNGRMDLWRAAAAQAGEELAQWMTQRLDEASSGDG
ncbi:LmbU family transcriptional regulator [Actinospica sp. MGRD01-02]|uniref:LmbU family transcriptional regulator n=1 Tax=Actinospica acidithermotolerans TaxID=2828514 RepID=A0A941E8C4_9ACTN|nr:LmbU family transcriptional regulator [Actinospica acidithermotolerans]MBR7826382.1 LmbU family transcriptional regulator [Actinospica acidithermotolerans]